MEYDIDKIRTHLWLGISHLQKAQKNGEQVAVLDDLELVYAGDCLAVALDECRPRGQETIGVRSLNNLVFMRREKQKENIRGRGEHASGTNITSHDTTSKASPAVGRVDEAKLLCKRAEAVWVYAKRSGDYELQNKAAEIRLFARQRAGELLAGMASHPSSRGQGRPRRDGAKIGLSNGTKVYPATLEEIAVIKAQHSKWQQIVRWMGALSSKKLGSTSSFSA